MTGKSILRQAYSLMDHPIGIKGLDGDENGLLAINQICGELWHREHTDTFVPLSHLMEPVDLSWRLLPAITYGVAALLCLSGGEEKPYDRFLERYMSALSHYSTLPIRRQDVWPSGVAE